MVAGHLQEKNGYFYAVFSYKDAQGKRKTKWIPTGYLIRGNKKKAEAFLMEQRQTYGGSGEGRTVCGLSGTLAENREEYDSDYDVQLLRRDDEKHHRSVVPQNRRDHHEIDSPRHSGFLHSTAGAGKVQHGDSLSCPHSSGAEICGKDRPAFRESSG
jgi:hypothetical protein